MNDKVEIGGIYPHLVTLPMFRCIKAICGTLGIAYEGKSYKNATDFIGEYKELSMKVRKGYKVTSADLPDDATDDKVIQDIIDQNEREYFGKEELDEAHSKCSKCGMVYALRHLGWDIDTWNVGHYGCNMGNASRRSKGYDYGTKCPNCLY